ncbi:hypothetical protein QOZ80_7AG0553520 [Eleusine coracana subsp. coracana]|nr:hypothetical protein QOZ80_7AG0553520 [Eleusine coracana subsp. coracana]
MINPQPPNQVFVMAAPPSSSRHVVPALMDDLVEAILLRLPPEDPASLLRAALVCKSWRRLVSGAGFRRRFREHHGRTPPMLGFLCSFGHRAGPLYYGEGDARFMPAAATSLRRLPRGATIRPRWRAVDALHGRILFYDRDLITPQTRALDFFVLSPMITDEVWRLPSLVPHHAHRWSAGLLCNSDHAHDDDDCAFRVVVLSTNPSTRITSAYVYSSEQHAWTIQTSVQHNHVCSILRSHSARIGNNALYFMCDSPNFCMEYHMSRQQLSVINLPSEWVYKWTNFMTAENGRLGLAMLDGYNLYTMSSKRTGVDGQVTWESSRVISLSKLLPDVTDVRSMHVAAVVDVLGVILIGTKIGLFSIDIKSSKVKKLWEGNVGCYVGDIVPTVSFCTPVLEAALPTEGPRSGASTA